MIDPGLDVDQIFGEVELPCNTARRINNTFNATVISEKLQATRPQSAMPTDSDQLKSLAKVQKDFKNLPKPQAPKRQVRSKEDDDDQPVAEVIKGDLKFDAILK